MKAFVAAAGGKLHWTNGHGNRQMFFADCLEKCRQNARICFANAALTSRAAALRGWRAQVLAAELNSRINCQKNEAIGFPCLPQLLFFAVNGLLAARRGTLIAFSVTRNVCGSFTQSERSTTTIQPRYTRLNL